MGADIHNIPSFQGVTFQFENRIKFVRKGNKNPNYAMLLRKLKSFAIEGNDHEMEMIFFANEMRAKRRHELTKLSEKTWNYIYDLTSFYGTSILRPSLGLFAVYVLFFKFNLLIPTQYCTSKLPNLLHLTLTNLIPLPVGLKSSQTAAINCLYGSVDQIPWSLMFLATLEGILGTIFLFLVLLGIRNKFKIK